MSYFHLVLPAQALTPVCSVADTGYGKQTGRYAKECVYIHCVLSCWQLILLLDSVPVEYRKTAQKQIIAGSPSCQGASKSFHGATDS